MSRGDNRNRLTGRGFWTINLDPPAGAGSAYRRPFRGRQDRNGALHPKDAAYTGEGATPTASALYLTPAREFKPSRIHADTSLLAAFATFS